MSVRRGLRGAALLVSVGLVAAAAVILVTALRSEAPAVPAAVDAPAPPPPPPAPEPEPEPIPEPVVGELAEVEVVGLDASGTGLFVQGRPDEEPVAVDTPAVDAFVQDTRDWVDAHLSALQLGEPDGVTTAGLAPGDTTGVTTRLASPDPFVEHASYRVLVGARGGPEWAHVAVEVVRAGGTATATFAFVPDGDDVVLVAAEAGP